MNWGKLLFGFQGRINHAKYWLAVLIYIVVSVLIGVIDSSLGPMSVSLTILHIIVGVGCFISYIAVGIKRFHDRNKTGWWLLIFYILPGVLIGAGVGLSLGGIIMRRGMMSYGVSSMEMIGALLVLVAFAIGIWAFIELGCLRGTIGANRHGPGPVAPKPAQH
jgi:uncharacterized membrane protein YhaH (DUF805 family)